VNDAYPEHLRALIEAYLQALPLGREGLAGRLREAMRYSLLAGGKRIRPVLTLAVVESLGRRPQAALPTAAAIELIHTYSLIHDDLPAIDNDDLRRGQPTCHKVFGEDIAILAGDALFAEAFGLIVDAQAAEAPVVLAILREVAHATGVGGMVGGQYLDVTAAAAAPADLRQLHSLKTGKLIEAAVVGGALLCEVTPPALEAYRAFAQELGVLFQIVDDILDVVGDEGALGKTAGKDAQAGKATYVTHFGLQGARELADASHARALRRLERLPGDPASLRAVTAYIRRRDR
jgi:geranylgeranyl diphosphate synthase type II